MELETFTRIFRKGGQPCGIDGYRNELIKHLDLYPTNDIIRKELTDTMKVYNGIRAIIASNSSFSFSYI